MARAYNNRGERTRQGVSSTVPSTEFTERSRIDRELLEASEPRLGLLQEERTMRARWRDYSAEIRIAAKACSHKSTRQSPIAKPKSETARALDYGAATKGDPKTAWWRIEAGPAVQERQQGRPSRIQRGAQIRALSTCMSWNNRGRPRWGRRQEGASRISARAGALARHEAAMEEVAQTARGTS